MQILVVDSTFFGKNINREKTCEHIKCWASVGGVQIEILSSQQGLNFYKQKFKELTNINYLAIPFSHSAVSPNNCFIAIEYLFRAAGIIFLRKRNWQIVYSISSTCIDIFVVKFLSLRDKKIRTFATFDNFVPKPNQRPGNLFKNIITYLASQFSLKLLQTLDKTFAYLTEANFNKLQKIINCDNKLIRFNNALSIENINSITSDIKLYDIGYLGRLHVAKGILDFLEVINIIKQKKKDIKAVIIGAGDPPTVTKINETIKRLELEDNIELKGFINSNEKYKILKSTKVFLFLSYDESYPISVLEAVSCGLPVVAYNLDIYKSSPYTLFNLHCVEIGNFIMAANALLKVLEENNNIRDVIPASGLVPSYKINSSLEIKIFKETLMKNI